MFLCPFFVAMHLPSLLPHHAWPGAREREGGRERVGEREREREREERV